MAYVIAFAGAPHITCGDAQSLFYVFEGTVELHKTTEKLLLFSIEFIPKKKNV